MYAHARARAARAVLSRYDVMRRDEQIALSCPSRVFVSFLFFFSAVVNSELIKYAFATFDKLFGQKFASRIDGSLTSGDGENCVGNTAAH